MFNAILINEITKKHTLINISGQLLLNYISFFRRMFGGTGGFYMQIFYMSLCTGAFGVAQMFLKNLELDLFIQ